MQRDLLFRLLLLLAFYIPTIPSFAQDQTDQNWYFGTGTRGIQFTRPGDTARLVTRPAILTYGNAGGAVASDPISGGLLFYTDGSVAYDATHRAMPNGSGLGGNSSGNQPAVIVAIPGQSGKYYIITNSATPTAAGQLRFSEVDMNLLGNNTVNPNLPAPPLGDVSAVKAVAVANLDNEAEAMIIIPHSNGIDFWLITQEVGTGDFNISTITAAGITGAATLTPGGTGLNFRATQFAYHASTNRLAVAPGDPNKSVMIFDFDNTAGTLTFDITTGFVFNSAVPSPATPPVIYDVEFSNTGDYLYVSSQGDVGNPGNVFQFDLVTANVTRVSALTQPIAKSYGLQIAPDSSIYHIYQATTGGPFLVGRITDPDTTLVNYEPLPFGNVGFNATQFPAFLAKSKLLITLDFTVSGTCANTPSTFFPVVTPGADSLVWDFGDGGGSNVWSPTYTYTQGQTFNVTLKAFSGGDSTVFSKPVTITQFDLQLTLVQDTTACSCELRFPKAIPAPPPCNPFQLTATAQGATGAVQWYGPSGALAGQTSLSLTSVDSAGFYYVIAQDPAGSGCVAYAGVNIKEYGVDDPRANIWYFGNNAGINFNQDFIPSTGADAIQGDLISAEGAAVICDRNGQIVLSTNGEQVFDRVGTPLLVVPPGLGGNQTSTQSALILPVAGDPTLYYIFVTQKVYPDVVPGYELRYAIFDLKRGAFGEVVDPDGIPANGASTVLFTKSTERITGNENWLIAHEYGNNNFRAYRISAQGISAPVISSIGSDHSLAVKENAEGYMKLSPNNILAVALSTPGVSNIVEVFDFADSTGSVVNARTPVDLQQTTGQVYGIEFSPSGTKLFASTIGAGSSLHEFAYDSTVSTYVRKPAIPVIPAAQEIGAIQRGPDGTIYVATNGAGSLGTIDAQENRDLPSTFNEGDFALAPGTTSTLGLPNFIQSIIDPTLTPFISATGLCFGLPTDFVGSGTDAIDTLTWFFGDGASQKGVNLTDVQHTYGAPGTYIVTLQLTNRCSASIPSLTDTVTISPIPNTLSGVISLCDGGDDERMVAIAAADATPDLIYAWSHGDSTRNPFPPVPANYTVTVTNGAGCSATGDWEVFDNRPQVELGPNLTICENTPVITLDASNPGAIYDWERNNVDFSTSQSIRVLTSAAGIFEYSVFVLDTFTTCSIKDSVIYTINPDAAFTDVAVGPTTCGGTDGTITLTITTPGTYSYTINGPSVATAGDQTGPGGTVTVSGLSAGAYNAMITNQITGCFDQRTVPLSDQGANFTVDIQRATTCNDANNRMQIRITTDPDQAAFTYNIVTGTTTVVVASGTQANNPTIPLGNGRYAAEVTNAAGCVVVSPVTNIRQANPVAIDSYTVTECATPSIEVMSTASSFLWTGQNIPLGQAVTNKITPTPPPGVWSYDLSLGGSATACPFDTTFVVSVGNDPIPLISQDDACQDVVTLSATPTGTYVYRWFRDGVALPPAAQSIQVTAPGDNGRAYRVEARNTLTGCVVSSLDTLVAVLGELTVSLSNPQPCDGTDFDITASVNQFPDSFTWELDNNVLPETDSVLTVANDLEGLYKVTVIRSTAGRSCTALDSVQVTIAPVTDGVLVDNGIICPDEANTDPNTKTVTLNPGSSFISYDWFMDGIPLGVTTPTYTATETGTYSVDLINSFGCASSDRITLTEECDPQVSGPNAFRPDGLNKEFYLFTFFIADSPFEIFIFNRWGEMVYHSDQRDFKWNGGYNNQEGQTLPPGTYSYLVKYKSSYRPDDGVQEYRGGVVLLR